ncbi:hypothetical protein XENOCAPTIV_026716 [Xenoophorus captivus]|uniref:Uncharacterized protein n=1 Tax=Xenoophorus captivus TaxID=1517983 RepID=A0ABV0RAL0_9TELE
MHGENMQTPCRKTPGRESNPGPSCCNSATNCTTVQPPYDTMVQNESVLQKASFYITNSAFSNMKRKLDGSITRVSNTAPKDSCFAFLLLPQRNVVASPNTASNSVIPLSESP